MKIEHVEPVHLAEVTSVMNTGEIAELLTAVYLLQDTADGLATTLHVGHSAGNPMTEPGAEARAEVARVRNKRIIHPVVKYFRALQDAVENSK